ncbi:hypothetical protein DVZ84_05735 [Streptomyces parvulus]|uniref:Uncharacterized protein n=1 Tax=Streptomyces parvulus TaxID=146923 RepID=A0A369VAV7_9ACTN|nr:hypothetical protein DVZ84_05735 [Streptomyces parvulus]
MPSVTVLVSSDTDIYISPGLYGDCLPTVSTGGAADSFRAGPSLCPRRPFMLAHVPLGGQRPGARGAFRDRLGTGIHVTPTQWPSSN